MRSPDTESMLETSLFVESLAVDELETSEDADDLLVESLAVDGLEDELEASMSAYGVGLSHFDLSNFDLSNVVPLKISSLSSVLLGVANGLGRRRLTANPVLSPASPIR